MERWRVLDAFNLVEANEVTISEPDILYFLISSPSWASVIGSLSLISRWET